jgi:capsular exopolysaccharide synthesis family protein
MGRIADALKKAQEERQEKLRLHASADRRSTPGPAVSTAPPAAPAAAPSPRRGALRLGDVLLPPMRGVVAPTAAAPLDVHSTVVAARERNSSITEQYRAIRTWLLSRGKPSERNCIAITSSVPGEGKSVTVANLAVVLSEVRHMQVLAVDCDLRQGTQARLFKKSPSPGLAEVLTGRAHLQEAISPTAAGNLSILPAGDCRGLNPAELLNSTAASRVFDEIRDRFHFVLVDTPPVQRLSDVGVIGALCTGIVMVVRMNKTAANLVRQSVHWLQSNHLHVMGCIAAACSLRAARPMYQGRDLLQE